MKAKVLLSLLFSGVVFCGSAQTLRVPNGPNPGTYIGATTNATTGNVGIGTDAPGEKLVVVGNVGVNLGSSFGFGVSSDKFTYDAKTVGHYALGWFQDTWNTNAPTAFLSSFGGIKFFTQGAPRMAITNTGSVCIGTLNPHGYMLAVGGKVIAEEVVVMVQSNWPDYVFETGYSLPSLSELEAYLRVNRHLPNVPSAVEVKDNGVNLGEMNAVLLKKVEELTLYMIEANKKIEALNNKVALLSKEK